MRKKQIARGFLATALVLAFAGCGFLADLNPGAASQIRAAQGEDKPTAKAANSKEEGHKQAVTEAVSRMNAGDYKAAVEEANGVLQADGDNDYAYSLRGLSKALNGDIEGGLKDVQKAYELNPHNVSNFYNMAMVYKLDGQLDQAKEWFQKVLAAEPSNTWSVYGIATIYADKGDDREALAWLAKAINLDPAVKATAASQDHFARFHGNPQFEKLIQ